MGADRITRGRRRAQRKRDTRGGLARGTTERRRAVGRQRVYRHRFPEPPLPPLPHVRALLSLDGAWSFPKKNRARELARSQWEKAMISPLRRRLRVFAWRFSSISFRVRSVSKFRSPPVSFSSRQNRYQFSQLSNYGSIWISIATTGLVARTG